MQRIHHLVWLILSSFGLLGTAQAEGFSIGASLGFPTFLEARVAYEADSFGLRGYAATFSDVVIGADAYFRFVTDPLGSGYRLGAGAWAVLGSSPMFGIRGLLGAVWAFSPGFSMALELRPMIPLNFSSSNATDGLVVVLLLSSFSLGFEFKL